MSPAFLLKYQTRAITVLKWSRDFRKIINKVKSIFATIFEIYFQSFSEWYIGFKANDTSFLLFCQISNGAIVYCIGLKLSHNLSKTVIFFFNSLLLSKHVCKAALSSFENLEPMIHFACISVKYQIAELKNPYFEDIT